ncbi:MAG: IS1634 family transposase, partial [Terracidiphilus sp.]
MTVLASVDGGDDCAFVRIKDSHGYKYLQIVESIRTGTKVRQHVLATLGQVDALKQSGKLDDLTRSLAKFSTLRALVDAQHDNSIQAHRSVSIGPALVFERLWQRLGIDAVIRTFGAEGRKRFPLERAIFLTALHRLMDPGSDRAAERWKEDLQIRGTETIELHHLYRAMGWLGERVIQLGSDPRTLRCRKDFIEEELFKRNRDLFTQLQLVFFDTTSLYFEGLGGESLGQYGHSKDHRPDLRQMVMGVVLDGAGRPICCELWPGNLTDVTTLIPVVTRLKERFAIESMCVVADREMISAQTIQKLESAELGLSYILGVRMHVEKEVRDGVLLSEEYFQQVTGAKEKADDPSPLAVREQWVGSRRYIVCYNEDQARKDEADRTAIVASLTEKLKAGDKSLVGNKGYRRYLKSSGPEHFTLDEAKIEQEKRFDGMWVLRTNTQLPAAEVALKYKQLWMVESIFRSAKSLLETRPIYHKVDDTIRGHVFCSFLALMLRQELQTRLESQGQKLEWDDIKRDLRALQEVEVEFQGKRMYLRTDLRGACHAVLKA